MVSAKAPQTQNALTHECKLLVRQLERVALQSQVQTLACQRPISEHRGELFHSMEGGSREANTCPRPQGQVAKHQHAIKKQ